MKKGFGTLLNGVYYIYIYIRFILTCSTPTCWLPVVEEEQYDSGEAIRNWDQSHSAGRPLNSLQGVRPL